jgi:hypothetical protein
MLFVISSPVRYHIELRELFRSLCKSYRQMGPGHAKTLS